MVRFTLPTRRLLNTIPLQEPVWLSPDSTCDTETLTGPGASPTLRERSKGSFVVVTNLLSAIGRREICASQKNIDILLCSAYMLAATHKNMPAGKLTNF